MNDTGLIRDSKCQVKLELMYQIRTTTHLVDALRNEQLATAAEGNLITGSLDWNRLREAQERETFLIEMLGKHVNEHGC